MASFLFPALSLNRPLILSVPFSFRISSDQRLPEKPGVDLIEMVGFLLVFYTCSLVMLKRRIIPQIWKNHHFPETFPWLFYAIPIKK